MKITARLLTLFACVATNAVATDMTLIDRLNKEEATWHKGMLFYTAARAKDPAEYLAVLEWLKKRVVLPNVPDSRYAMTYSMMLGGTKNPSVMDTANAFAIIGYATLQVDTARCKNRHESWSIARQWYYTVRPRMSSLKELPLETRERYWKSVEPYVQAYADRREEDLVKSSSWLCFNLPSYLAKIQNLPDVVIETSPGPNQGNMNVHYSHPTVVPELASSEEFEYRVKSIMRDMQMMVVDSK